MNERHLVIIVLVAIGTYLTRLLPFHLMNRMASMEKVEEFLKHSSAAIISALFITSLIGFPFKLKDTFVEAVALLFVFVFYKRWKSVGISVLAGVVSHFMVSWLMR